MAKVMTATPNAIDCFSEYAYSASFDGLSDSAVRSLKTFVLDSIGVGVCGSRLDNAKTFARLVQSWAPGSAATIWSTGERTSASGAAMLNAWQIHNQEFDCIHEKAVVHPMAVILPCLMAYAEQAPKVDGKKFLVALSVAIDAATLLGEASSSPVRFFRPAICGAIGATIGMAKLADLSTEQIKNAFGLIYSQISGTMQAHTEGSPMLAMQIAFNARSAMNALDMATNDFDAPRDVLEGPFGFFSLIEPEHTLEKTLEKLGKEHQIEHVSHKPFPTGRACHGGLDALEQLLKSHEFSAEDINKGVLSAPPLIEHLTGREANQNMSAAYARLCFPYSAACFIIDGDVAVDSYNPIKMQNAERIALAQRFSVQSNKNGDPNAMTPQTLSIELNDGRVLHKTIEATLGSPNKPLTREQHLQKFRRCCTDAAVPLDASTIDQLIYSVDKLEQLDDVSVLCHLAGAGQSKEIGV